MRVGRLPIAISVLTCPSGSGYNQLLLFNLHISYILMAQTVPATQAKNNFGELIRRVYTTGQAVIIEKSGIPVAVIHPYHHWASNDLDTPNRVAESTRVSEGSVGDQRRKQSVTAASAPLRTKIK